MCNQGSDERKVNQRGNHPGISALYAAIRQNIYEAFFKLVMSREVLGKGFWREREILTLILLSFFAILAMVNFLRWFTIYVPQAHLPHSPGRR